MLNVTTTHATLKHDDWPRIMMISDYRIRKATVPLNRKEAGSTDLCVASVSNVGQADGSADGQARPCQVRPETGTPIHA
jgi:hypothetical protein